MQPEEGAAAEEAASPPAGSNASSACCSALRGLAASRLGQLWIAFDVFSHFTLQFAVMALAFLIGLLMPRAKLLAAFVVMVIGIVGHRRLAACGEPQARHRSARCRPGERALKVASFNTLWVNHDADAVKAEIERSMPTSSR